MIINASIDIARGEEIYRVEADGHFSHDEFGLNLERWSYEAVEPVNIVLTHDEADQLVQCLYDEVLR